MAVERRNRQEVPRLMHLAEVLGATSLKINPLILCGRAKTAFSRGLNLDLDEFMALHDLTETVRQEMDGLDAFLDLPPAFLSLEEIRRRGVSHCRILNILGILAGGDISLCGIGQTESGLCMGNM